VARKISVTKAELAALREALHEIVVMDTAHLRRLLAKAEAAHAEPAVDPDQPKGISVANFEAALQRTGGAKVVPMGKLALGGYIVMGHQLAQRGITVEQVEAVGTWLKKQAWLRDPVTAEGVLRKWGDWAGKALAKPVAPRRSAPAPLEWEPPEYDK